MTDLDEDAFLIDKSERSNSLTTSTAAAYRIRQAWDDEKRARRYAEEDKTRDRAQMEAHLVRVTARLEAERDEARAENTAMRAALAGPLAEFNRILGGDPS